MITCSRYYAQLQCSAISITRHKTAHKVLIYSHRMARVMHEILPPLDSGRAFDLSYDGKWLATGYWNRRGVDVWSLERGEVVASFGPSQVSRVFFDQTGSRLLVQSECETSINSIKDSRDKVQVLQSQDLEDGCFIKGHNQILLPSRRRSKVLKVDFKTTKVSEITVPLNKTACWIRHSPATNTLFIIDTADTIWCFDSSLKKQLWRTTIKDLPKRSGIYVGTYSGNGALIGLTLTSMDGFDTIVLNAETGQEVGRVCNTPSSGYPWKGNSVILESQQVLNLRTGKIVDAFPGASDC